MELISRINNAVNSFVWGPIMLVLIVGTGIYLSIRASSPGQAVRLRGNTIATLFKKGDKDALPPTVPTSAVCRRCHGSCLHGWRATAGVAGATRRRPRRRLLMWVSAFFACAPYAECPCRVSAR